VIFAQLSKEFVKGCFIQATLMIFSLFRVSMTWTEGGWKNSSNFNMADRERCNVVTKASDYNCQFCLANYLSITCQSCYFRELFQMTFKI